MSRANQKQSTNAFSIELKNEQSKHKVDASQLTEAARYVLLDSEFSSATVSLAVVDDEMMQELNRRYLNHDWPTDVLSFVLDASDGHLEGEIVISADTAAAAATEVGWPAAAEQLLYVIHGTLHLAGYNDESPAEAAQMRAAEARYLEQFALQ